MQEFLFVELASLVTDVVGLSGMITCDPGKPVDVARKRLNISRTEQLGWTP